MAGLDVGDQAAFIPLIFVMAGRWSAWAAKRDREERELVTQDLAQHHNAGMLHEMSRQCTAPGA